MRLRAGGAELSGADDQCTGAAAEGVGRGEESGNAATRAPASRPDRHRRRVQQAGAADRADQQPDAPDSTAPAALSAGRRKGLL
jgi:hypothetical protein